MKTPEPIDTRRKIRTAASLPALEAEFPGAVFVATSADPLTVALARRLDELARSAAGAGARKPLVIALTDPPDALLPVAARAELVAALDSVSAVAVGVDPAALAALAPGRLIREDQADAERLRSLMESVHARHALSGAAASSAPGSS